jgi:hypothetical protein
MPDFILTPTILAGSLILQSMARPSSAVSMEADALQKKATSIEQDYERSIALFGDKARLLESLRELVEECSEDDWDGYGASAVNVAVVANSESFIRALPDRFEIPELSVDPDGDISFDWIPDHTKTFTLSVNGSNRLAYAWIDGVDRGHATAKFENCVIPDRVLAEIKTITNNDSTFRAA